MRIKYGLFHFRESGYYHPRSCLQWFDDRGSALNRACKMNTDDDGIHIIVHRVAVEDNLNNDERNNICENV